MNLLRACSRILAQTATLLVILAVPVTARAQTRPPREGLWAGLGAGFGAVHSTDTTGTGHSSSGPTVQARIGLAVNRRILVGLEGRALASFRDTDSYFGFDVDSYLALTAILVWYPWAGHLQLTGGLGSVVAGDLPDQWKAHDPLNPMAHLGVGYDITSVFSARADAAIWGSSAGFTGSVRAITLALALTSG